MNLKLLLVTLTVASGLQTLAASPTAATPASTSQFQTFKEIKAEQKTMAFNIGYSRLDQSSYSGPSAAGLTFEGGYAFTKKILGTAGFFHYDYSGATGNSNFQMAAVGAEIQPIQTGLFSNAEFFAAVTTGGAYIFDVNNGFNLYYGAGLGVKINPEMGVRFDIKSGRNYITSHTISLVGYY